MLSDLYTKDVLKAAAGISRTGRLDAAQATSARLSPVCGSKITIDLQMEGDTVSDYAQDIEACALGQAAASLLAKKVIGLQPSEVQQGAGLVHRMLVNGAPIEGNWQDFNILAQVHDHKARHGAVMLALEATLAACAEITGTDYLGNTALTRAA
jgi:NifU-like protein involved in Fe-S cluster formation